MENYDTLDLIGEGSFGKVHRGRAKQTNSIVALKLISKVGRQEKELKSLRQECTIQKGLTHPNIIHMLDSFETDKHVVVVTEYAPGELFGLLEKEGRLPVERVQRIACNLVSALHYLHSNRILHRDIKPQNILIGADGVAKLCDFGFARTMGIDTYMLTSVKGTPLYMAPEIVHEKPYDHNADLWSLGCILYELLVGSPPFSTTSLLQLVKKIRNDTIVWPDFIVGHCRTFLQGLLEKDPQKRLTWPLLLEHPFVIEELRVEGTDEKFSLTKALSPSQELAKEKQRDHLQQKLAGYSKLLIKTAKKMEEAQSKLNKCSNEGKIRTPLPSPCNDPGNARPSSSRRKTQFPITPNHEHNHLKISPNSAKNPQKLASIVNQLSALNIQNGDEKNNNKVAYDGRSKAEGVAPDSDSASSCETFTSSSDLDSYSDEDGRTVILHDKNDIQLHKRVRKKSVDNRSKGRGSFNLIDLTNDQRNSKDNSEGVWKSGALFTLHTFENDDKPIESEEWVYFLIKTIKEVMESPKSLCEKHFLTVVVLPLRNHLAEAEVIEKIATLLSVPFTMDINSDQEPNLTTNLQSIYLDTKVLPNLLFSCKVAIRRRQLGKESLDLNEILCILTVEDLGALSNCLRLVCFLVHADDDFVVQFCDSVCVLQAFEVLQLFLKLDKRKTRFVTDALAILCHVARTIPSNISILEDLLLDNDSKDGGGDPELWRLLTHNDYLIQSRSLRILAYMVIHSEKARGHFVKIHYARIWRLLHNCASHAKIEVQQAATFALQNIKYLASHREDSDSIKKSKSDGEESQGGSNTEIHNGNHQTPSPGPSVSQ